MLEIKRSKLKAGPKRKKALTRLKKVGIAVVILVLLFLGAGVLYTWYMGQKPAVVTRAPTPTAKTVNLTTPHKPDVNAKVGAAVQNLTTPIKPGANASITVRTLAGAACSIQVLYNKEASTDSGLIPKVADEFGVVSWTWTVETSRPLGKWPVNVTCGYNDRSAFVRGDLIVSDTTE